MEKNNKVVSYIDKPTGKITLTWIPTSSIEQYKPVFQVYAVCFISPTEVLLISENNKWKIPGGTPEKGEKVLETLKRELKEEADIEIEKAIPIGIQKVEYPNNPNKTEGELYYQLRYICKISKVLPQTPDPDKGVIHPREFVTPETVLDRVKWGEAGTAMFIEAFKNSGKLFDPKS